MNPSQVLTYITTIVSGVSPPEGHKIHDAFAIQTQEETLVVQLRFAPGGLLWGKLPGDEVALLPRRLFRVEITEGIPLWSEVSLGSCNLTQPINAWAYCPTKGLRNIA